MAEKKSEEKKVRKKKVDDSAAIATLEGEEVVKAKESHALLYNTDREMAMDFAARVHEKFDRLIKASVLFGSQIKKTATASSDIDIALILDDASIGWDLELIAWYREELGKIIASMSYGKDIHVTTIKLTTFWNDLLHGDPVVINILRYGETLIDSGGFFNPLKALLQRGMIKSTHEAVYISLERAPMHLLRSKASKLGAIEGAYWTFVDSAQAALMTVGKLPPSPEHIPGLLQDEFVERRILKDTYVQMAREAYNIHKAITHGAIRDIPGAKIDQIQANADAFLSEMIRIINLILDSSQKDENKS